jgi:hypothetical protein
MGLFADLRYSFLAIYFLYFLCVYKHGDHRLWLLVLEKMFQQPLVLLRIKIMQDVINSDIDVSLIFTRRITL